MYTHQQTRMYLFVYGVATISRLLTIIGLFCNRALKRRPYSAKETYTFKEPTNRSHPTHTLSDSHILIYIDIDDIDNICP